MARAHFVTYLLDSEGRPIPGATVDVREPDTETLISETVYAEDDTAGNTELGNPFTAAVDGKCEIWLTAPKVVDLYVTKTGYDPSTIRAIAHQLTASDLTVAEAGTPLAQRATLNFLAGFDLTDDAANDETEVALDLTEVSAFTDHSARHEVGGADEIAIAVPFLQMTDTLEDTTSTGTINDFDPGDNGMVRFSLEATLTGVVAAASEGRVLVIANDGAGVNALTIAHDDAGSSLANRIYTPGNVDLTLGFQEHAVLVYHGSRWVVVAVAQKTDHELGLHLTDTDDAHDSSAISYDGGAVGVVGDDVEAAINSLQANIDAAEAFAAAELATHNAWATDVHDASAISIVDSGGNFAATDVEAALAEEADARQAHAADAADAHDASSISVLDSGGYYSGGTVEDVLEEIAAGEHFVLKGVDEAVANSTTLQNDNELFFSVGAGEFWTLELVIIYSANEANDLKWDLSLPTGGSALGMDHGLAGGAVGVGEDILRATDQAGHSQGGIAGADRALHIRVAIEAGDAGTVNFRFAQNSSGPTNTTIRAGSYLIANRRRV